MKNKKRIYIIVLFLSIFVILFISFRFSKEAPKTTENLTQKISDAKKILEKKDTAIKTSTKTPMDDYNNALIILKVLGKTYSTKVKEGSTVYDAMLSIKNESTNNFSFSSKNYPSLGIFVDKINNEKGTPGKYWIYYVNGKEASVSVSKNILKSGDTISWEQE